LAASSLSPSTVFGMYLPLPGHTVIPFLAASAPGRAKNPTSLTLSGATVSIVGGHRADLRVLSRGSGGDRLDPVGHLG
jgi:hypothetical protein